MSATEPIALSTAIIAVTVYSDRARITRAGEAELPAGRQRLTVGPLPFGLDDDSLAGALAGDGVALLSLEVEQQHGREVSRAQTDALLTRRDTLREQLQALDDQQGALDDDEEFLATLTPEPSTDEQDNPRPIPLRPGRWEAALAFVEERLTDVRARSRALERQAETLRRELADVELELRAQRSYDTRARKQVIAELRADRAGAVRLELSYTVAGPSWRPSYDLHVDAAGEAIELALHGVVEQATGEDWAGVALQLSTAAPRAGAQLPELLAWRLGDTDQLEQAAADGAIGAMDAGDAVSAGEAPAGALRMRSTRAPAKKRKAAPRPQAPPPAPEMPAASMAPPEPMYEHAKMEVAEEAIADVDDWDEELEFDDVAPQPPPPPAPRRARRPTADVRRMGTGAWSLPAGAELRFRPREGGFAVAGDVLLCPTPHHAAAGFDHAYSAEGAQTIASDGRARRIPLGEQRLDAALRHEVVAPLDRRAFLGATVRVGDERPLLAGESFLFLDGGFVGRAFLDTVPAGGELELSLGVDDDVKVERDVEQTTGRTGLLSKRDRTVYRVEVRVRSFRDRPLAVRVRDQLPVTWRPDDVEIETLELSPRPDDEPDRGMLAWTLELPARGRASVTLEYAVERPPDHDLRWAREDT